MFSVFDVEAYGFNDFKVGAIMDAEGDVKVARNPDQLRHFVEEANGNTFAHFGGGMDFLFLMPLQNVFLSGSRIARGQIGKNWVKDTSKLTNKSLAKVAKWLGKEKFGEISRRPESVSIEKLTDHVINDCELVRLMLIEHRNWIDSVEHPEPRWPTTAGANALYLMEAFEPETVEYLSEHPLDPSTWMAMHQGCSGSRNECFIQGQTDGIFAYDINGSYTQSLFDGPLPAGPFRHVTREVAGHFGLYYCKKIKQNRSRLPIVCPSSLWKFDGEGWLTAEEIQAVRIGGGEVVVEHGWICKRGLPMGQASSRFVYPFKQSGMPWAKDILNALPGKYSEPLHHETYVWDDQRGYEKDVEISLPGWHQQPIIAAYIFARARLRLGRVMQQIQAMGFKVYYCDTDSIHTNCPPSKFPAPLSDECGEWKLEVSNAEGIYLAPKLYALRDDMGKLKIVSRGMDPETLTWELFERALTGERIEVGGSVGLVGFLSMMHNPSYKKLKTKDKTMTLAGHTGGKVRLEDGTLIYQDDVSKAVTVADLEKE